MFGEKKKSPAFLICRRENFCLSCRGAALWGRTPDYLVELWYACAQQGPHKHSNTLTNGQYGAFKKMVVSSPDLNIDSLKSILLYRAVEWAKELLKVNAF